MAGILSSFRFCSSSKGQDLLFCTLIYSRKMNIFNQYPFLAFSLEFCIIPILKISTDMVEQEI